jgi:cytochrome c oxidase subunit IV
VWRLAGIKLIAMPPILFIVILILPPSNVDMEFFMALYVL